MCFNTEADDLDFLSNKFTNGQGNITNNSFWNGASSMAYSKGDISEASYATTQTR